MAELCPTGLIRLYWSSLWFLWCKIIICRPYLCVSNCCKMSLSPIIKASNLLLWKTCAPQGSFVFNGHHCGFCGAKFYMSTLLCVWNPRKMSSSINIKAWSLSLWQTCAPQGSFVFNGPHCGFCGAKSYMSTFLCVWNPRKMSLSINIKAWSLSLWQTCAPQGSFVFTGANYSSVMQNQ